MSSSAPEGLGARSGTSEEVLFTDDFTIGRALQYMNQYPAGRQLSETEHSEVLSQIMGVLALLESVEDQEYRGVLFNVEAARQHLLSLLPLDTEGRQALLARTKEWTRTKKDEAID